MAEHRSRGVTPITWSTDDKPHTDRVPVQIRFFLKVEILSKMLNFNYNYFSLLYETFLGLIFIFKKSDRSSTDFVSKKVALKSAYFE